MTKSKLLALFTSILLLVSLLVLPASAASIPKAEDFAEVFTSGITWSDTDSGVKMTFGGGRITYMKPVQMDGLKVVFKQVSLTAPTKDASLGLWITFGQEAGHFWGPGATGTIFRLSNTVDGVTAYVKRADDDDDAGDDIFFSPSYIGLKGFPITLTITFDKVGDKYEVSMNGAKFQVDAAKIDSTLSASGKSFFTFGIADYTGSKSNSLVVAEISNSKAPVDVTTTPTTAATTAPIPTTSEASTDESTPDPVADPSDESTPDPVADPSDESTPDPVADPSDESTPDPAADSSDANTGVGQGKKEGNPVGTIILIVVIAVVLIAGVVAVIFLSKKGIFLSKKGKQKMKK